MSVLEGLQRVAHLGMTRIALETDSTNLEKGLKSNELDRNAKGCLFYQIREIMNQPFIQCVVQACPQSCNKVAGSFCYSWGER